MIKDGQQRRFETEATEDEKMNSVDVSNPRIALGFAEGCVGCGKGIAEAAAGDRGRQGCSRVHREADYYPVPGAQVVRD